MNDFFNSINFSVDGFNELIANGHNPNIHSVELLGMTPLHAYCLNSNIEMVDLLLKAGANPNALDDYGRTPIHYAGTIEVVDLLLKSGADVNAQDNNGLTILHRATKLESISHLLDCDADATIIDNQGYLPYQHKSGVMGIFLKDAYDDAINKQQKERILEAVNEEQPIEHKPTQKRRRM